MNVERRQYLLVACAFAGAILTIMGLSYSYFLDQRSAADSQMQELADCRQLAGRIEAARGAGENRRGQPATFLDLPRAIADAATSTGLPNDCIEGIHPDAMRKSASGGFIEKPTRLSLHHVTLAQALSLLVNLDRPTESLRIEKLHLTAETGQSEGNSWSADALLIHSATVSEAQASAETR